MTTEGSSGELTRLTGEPKRDILFLLNWYKRKRLMYLCGVKRKT